MCNSILRALDKLFCFHFGKILLFYKLILPHSEVKLMVLELITRDSEHCCWLLLFISHNACHLDNRPSYHKYGARTHNEKQTEEIMNELM